MTDLAEQERRGLLLGFGVFGVFWGAWSAVLPAVERNAHVRDGILGLALGALAMSAVPAMPLAGRLVDRVGARRALPGALLAFALASPLAGLATTSGGLVAALVALGATTGVLDVVLNTTTAGWERNTGRALMSTAHGLFSVGVLVGSAVAGLARQGGADVLVILFGVRALTGVTLGTQPLYRRPDGEAHAAGFRGSRRVLLGLGTLTACAFLFEDAVQSWSALHLERGLDASPAVSDLGPALFAGSMAAGRLGGGWLGSQVREERLLSGCAVVAGLGVVVVALAPNSAVALLGLVLAGAGTSVLAPVLYSAVGARAAAGRQGADLAAVTALGYLGFVAGPPLVGGLSASSSLPIALGCLAVFTAVIAVSGPYLLSSSRSGTPAGAPGSR